MPDPVPVEAEASDRLSRSAPALPASPATPATRDAAPAGRGPGKAPGPRPISTFHALRYRDFRYLWAGNAFMSAAQWIQITTMGWVSYDLTGSGGLVGVISSVGNLFSPAIAPFSGLASDRFSRTHVVAVSQGLLFVNALVLAMIIAAGWLEVWHLFLFALVAGALNAFNMPARQTLVFDVVPRDVVPNAVALSNLAFSTMRTAGPMVGGGLIALFGPANNFVVQAIAYLCVALSALMVRVPRRPASVAGSRFVQDIAEGYRWAFANPQARILLLMLTIYPTFIIPLHNALMPIFAKDIFEGGPSSLGVFLSALGAGGIVGGLLAASLNVVDRRGLLQLNAMFLCSLSQAGFAAMGALTGNVWLGAILLFLAGIGGSIFNTTNQTVVQLIAPDYLRGRITSVMQVQPLCMATGTLVAGALSDVYGAVAVGVGINLLAFGVTSAVLAFSPRMRALRLSGLAS
ncbi:MAG TPA: MFS transporter [Dehalococcoidia bacterium]|nr:MFS transporter [Dehalococcoidia bacterium]